MNRVLLVLIAFVILIFQGLTGVNQLVYAGTSSTSVIKKILKTVAFVSSTRIQPRDTISPLVHKGLGPGFIFDGKGHILVQNSTLSDIHSIECAIPGLGYWPAVLLGSDPDTGISVLELKAPKRILSSLQPVVPAKSSNLAYGQRIYAVGINPNGSPFVLTGNVTLPRCPISLGESSLQYMIQVSMFIHRGLNGGPVFDAGGHVVGMAIKMPMEVPPNMGFVLPWSQVNWIADSIIKKGKVERAYLGVKVVTVTPTLGRLLNLPAERGALVVKVEKGSPAARAGLKGCSRDLRLGNRLYPMGGDLIVALNRTPITSDEQLIKLLNKKGPGTKVLISFYRGRRLMRQIVTLGSR